MQWILAMSEKCRNFRELFGIRFAMIDCQVSKPYNLKGRGSFRDPTLDRGAIQDTFRGAMRLLHNWKFQ
jgi:hypothetical protein